MKSSKEMKKLLLLICLLLNYFIGFSQDIDINRISRRYIYQNQDGVFNWYAVGFITFDEGIFIRDKDYHTYFFSNSTIKKNVSVKELVKSPDIYFVDEFIMRHWPYIYLNMSEYTEIEKLIPDDFVLFHSKPVSSRFWRYYENEERRLNKKLYVASPSLKDLGFLLLLMTGKAFNHITYYSIIDGAIEGPVPFPDENAYYKVLVPLIKKEALKNYKNEK